MNDTLAKVMEVAGEIEALAIAHDKIVDSIKSKGVELTELLNQLKEETSI